MLDCVEKAWSLPPDSPLVLPRFDLAEGSPEEVGGGAQKLDHFHRAEVPSLKAGKLGGSRARADPQPLLTLHWPEPAQEWQQLLQSGRGSLTVPSVLKHPERNW